MGSKGVDLLSELRRRSQIDCDTLDIAFAKELGPFIGSTSNQADAYFELLLPHRADLLQDSLVLAREINGDYNDVPFEEQTPRLMTREQMVKLALAIAPHVKETVFVMSNPSLTSIAEVVKNASRLVALTSRISPSFPLSRLCIKVAATWEGLQACRQLTALGIQTLATTLFTMEQAILAGECGCMYVSPFVHELKAVFDDSYNDGGANNALCVDAQQYYEHYSYSTRVKAAALLSVREAKELAGVAAITIPPDLLRTLASTEVVAEDIDEISLFAKAKQSEKSRPERRAYMDDETAWREAFSIAYDGGGLRKTNEVRPLLSCNVLKLLTNIIKAIDAFREYQIKGEQLMREKESR
ncbi:MAG: hypothetical protein Q9169_006548 [Polycauliona sp. 2 TL-2023]